MELKIRSVGCKIAFRWSDGCDGGGHRIGNVRRRVNMGGVSVRQLKDSSSLGMATLALGAEFPDAPLCISNSLREIFWLKIFPGSKGMSGTRSHSTIDGFVGTLDSLAGTVTDVMRTLTTKTLDRG
jgi:hypothetical protein